MLSKHLDELVDINDVHINTELPKEEKILDYLRQIKNPYMYKNRGYIVEVEYKEDGKTFEEIFTKIIENIMDKE